MTHSFPPRRSSYLRDAVAEVGAARKELHLVGQAVVAPEAGLGAEMNGVVAHRGERRQVLWQRRRVGLERLDGEAFGSGADLVEAEGCARHCNGPFVGGKSRSGRPERSRGKQGSDTHARQEGPSVQVTN